MILARMLKGRLRTMSLLIAVGVVDILVMIYPHTMTWRVGRPSRPDCATER